MVDFPKSDTKVLQEQDDVEMLKRPSLWPRWPIIPVKRYPDGSNRPRCGVVFDDRGDTWSVLLVNMFVLAELPLIDGVEKIVYDSPEAIVADGWMVD